MSILFTHHCGSKNVGDAQSGPYHYFDFPGERTVAPIRDLGLFPDTAATIVGGGAVMLSAARISSERPNVIAWGVGRSRHGETKPGRVLFDHFALFGSREYGQPGAIYVPCASCMSPLFDKWHEGATIPERGFGVFLNADPAIRRRYPVNLPGLPTLYNDSSFEETIRFLATSDVVLTNSYHGAYWATLLGREVIVVNAYSSKFHGFKFPPAFAPDSDWKSAILRGPYFGALADARAANRAFHARVMEVLTPALVAG